MTDSDEHGTGTQMYVSRPAAARVMCGVVAKSPQAQKP